MSQPGLTLLPFGKKRHDAGTERETKPMVGNGLKIDCRGLSAQHRIILLTLF